MRRSGDDAGRLLEVPQMCGEAGRQPTGPQSLSHRPWLLLEIDLDLLFLVHLPFGHFIGLRSPSIVGINSDTVG